MSNFSEQQQARTEVKEKSRTRREKLASLFYDFAKLTYTALVLGSIVLLFQSDKLDIRFISMMAFGGIAAYLWVKMGNNLLK